VDVDVDVRPGACDNRSGSEIGDGRQGVLRPSVSPVDLYSAIWMCHPTNPHDFVGDSAGLNDSGETALHIKRLSDDPSRATGVVGHTQSVPQQK
jgi:hypothetical protein